LSQVYHIAICSHTNLRDCSPTLHKFSYVKKWQYFYHLEHAYFTDGGIIFVGWPKLNCTDTVCTISAKGLC